MATYTYKCSHLECDIYNIPFEVEMSMKEPNLTKCPECGDESLQMVIETAGGGFRIGGMGVHKPTAHWGD